VNCVKRSNSSALNLLKIIVNNFASFRDQAIYKEREGIVNQNLKFMSQTIRIQIELVFDFHL
jgi:hypothetical protein